MTPTLQTVSLSLNLAHKGCVRLKGFEVSPSLIVAPALDRHQRVIKDRYVVYHLPTMTVLLPTFGHNPLDIALEMARRLSYEPFTLSGAYDGSPESYNKLKPVLHKIMIDVINSM